MNKIIVVGHPSSKYEEVETLLNDWGMVAAQPSRQEGILPAEIVEILCKAHGVNVLNRSEFDDEVHQIEVSPVWNGMALDLLRGNLEQQLWGWADPHAVYFLDYWKNLDPKFTFILVYNHPRCLLTQDSENTEELTSQTLDQRVHKWCTYNAALLHFYHRNSECCLLVHAGQARASAKSYLQQVRARIDATLDAGKTEIFVNSGPSGSNTSVQSNRSKAMNQPENCKTLLAETTWQNMGVNNGENSLKQYIAEALINQFPDGRQMYEELQSVANLPYAGEEFSSHSAFVAWKTMAKQYDHSRTLTTQNREQQIKISELQKCIQDTNALSEAKKQQITLLNQEQQRLKSTQKESQQENEQLLLQLHHVQEKLERYYLENQNLKTTQYPSPSVYYGAADRIKRQLSYRLGASMIENSRTFGGWLSLPWTLIRVTRQFRKEKKQRKKEKLPPIYEYCDFHEAKRVKQHLSYRLGATMIANVRSPIGGLKLPWLLRREVKDFRRGREGLANA